MAHFVRTQLDATWTTGNYVPPVTDWQGLDGKIFAAVNGDLGGTWAPAAPIIIQGTNSPLGYVDVSGPVLVDFGGSLTLANASAAPVRYGAGYFPEFAAGHALRARSIPTSCLERQGTFARWHFRNVETAQYTGIRGSFIAAPTAGGVLAAPPGFILPLRVHDGARLAQVRLTFRVPTPRVSKPYAVPQMRVVRADASGNLVPLRSFAAGATVDGYVPVAAPADGPSWYARGAVQTFTYVCDQNNVIDVSQYTYFIQVVEEQAAPGTPGDGALVLDQKTNARVVDVSLSPALSGAATIDGVAVATGDRVLSIYQSAIYVANTGGAWTVAADATTLTPNCIVAVTEGTLHRGEVWQYGTTGIDPANVLGQRWVRQVAGVNTGNVYHAAICDFDSIADMRFQ